MTPSTSAASDRASAGPQELTSASDTRPHACESHPMERGGPNERSARAIDRRDARGQARSRSSNRRNANSKAAPLYNTQ